MLAPVGGHTGCSTNLECLHTFIDCLHNDILGFSEGCLEVSSPIELRSGLQQLPERNHGVGHGEGVSHLIHQTEPGPDASDVSRLRKVPD